MRDLRGRVLAVSPEAVADHFCEIVDAAVTPSVTDRVEPIVWAGRSRLRGETPWYVEARTRVMDALYDGLPWGWGGGW